MEPTNYDGVAEFYDEFASTAYDVAFFVERARRTAGPVLELMSGTGRVSLPLIEAGVPLTCVDLSAGMLAVLSRKLEARGLKAEVIQADVRSLDLAPRFGLALLPFQAFSELIGEQDRAAALRSIRRCLRPGGRFIVTLHNPILRRRQSDGVHRLTGRHARPGGSLVVSGFEEVEGDVVRRLQFFEFFGPDGVMTSRRVQEMRFALIGREEMLRLAAAARFREFEVLGDYDGAPFDAERSRFIIEVLIAE